MPLRVFRLEEDQTGISPNNLIPNESHTLPATGTRWIVTKRGPFFTRSVRVVDATTNRTLVPRVDYDCVQLEVEQTDLSGKEVCSIIIIRNEQVSQNVLVTYQAYGGWLSYSVTAIIEMIEALNLDEREISWGQLVGVPDRLPAAPHRHPLSDVVGWHKLFPGLYAIRDAILLGDQAAMDAIREGFGREIDRIDADMAEILRQLNLHLNATGNVHNLHIHQIGGLLSSEINDLLDLKLDKTGKAADSFKLAGLDLAGLLAWMNPRLNYSQIVTGIVPPASRASGYNVNIADQIVTNAGYRRFSDLLNQYQDKNRQVRVIHAGNVGWQQARSIFANNSTYPGPLLVGHTLKTPFQVGTGNGVVTHYNIDRGLEFKDVNGNWSTLMSISAANASFDM